MESKTKTVKKVAKVKKEKVEVSETLDQALFNFQALNVSVPRNGVGKDKDGGEYTYAEIEDINTAINPHLFSVGLMISTVVNNDTLDINLIHAKTGEKRISQFSLGIASSPQELGARITMYRRYGIGALLNLVLDKSVKQDVKNPEINTTPIIDTIKPAKLADDPLALKATPQVIQEALKTFEKGKESPLEGKSEPFKKAYNAIMSAVPTEVIEELISRIKASERLNDTEKEELILTAEKRDAELNGTVY